MGFIASFIIALAFAVVGELLRPKQKPNSPKPAALDDFNLPTVSETRNWPWFAGTVNIEGPNCTWYGDLRSEAIKKKVKTGWFSSAMQTINIKYFLGVEMFLGIGGATGIHDVLEVRFGGEMPKVGKYTKNTTADEIVFTFNDPDFFGGNAEDGGVVGVIRIAKGTQTQNANSYLQTVLGRLRSAYRGLSYAVMEAFYVGTRENMKTISFVVQRFPNTLGVPSGKHIIGTGDANPICMIYEILTDQVWGGQIPTVRIDTANFLAKAEQMHTEGYGLSMLINSSRTAEDQVAEMLRHIDGVLYTDLDTGLITLAVARDDYDEETLPVFDDSNITSFSFSRGSWSETKNTILLQYVDRADNFTPKTLPLRNLANVFGRGGVVETEKLDFLGFSNAEIAAKRGHVALKTSSYPLLSGKITVNSRTARSLRPGKVIKVNYSPEDIEGLILRVVRINFGDMMGTRVEMDCIEDVFSITNPAFTVPPPSNWVDPVGAPQPLVAQHGFEAPYHLIGMEARHAITLGSRFGGIDSGYEVWQDPLGGSTYAQSNEVFEFTPTGLILGAYPDDTAATDTVGFVVTSPRDFASLVNATPAEFLAGESLLLIVSSAGQEVCAWRTVVNNFDGTYTVSNVMRGVFDTIPLDHPAGARVWIISQGMGRSSETPYIVDGTVTMKYLPRNVRGVLAIADATQLSVAIASRSWKPYPAASLLVDGSDDETGITGDAVLTWKIRHRLLQSEAGVVVPQDAANYTGTPEGGYEVKVYIDGVLARTAAIIAAPFDTFTYTVSMRLDDNADASLPVQMTVQAVNGSYRSVVRETHEFFLLDALDPLIITTVTLPPGIPGEAYSEQLEATGGAEPYTWTIVSGTLPDGLTLSSSGLLSGTPTEDVEATFTVGVEGAAGSTDTQVLELLVTGLCGLHTIPGATGETYNLDDVAEPTPAIGNELHVCNELTNSPLGPSDPDFASVVALLHFDGADGSTTFTDVTGKTWTANGDVQLDVGVSPFTSGVSALFDGTGDSLDGPASADFSFGTGDFTMEAWVRPASTALGANHFVFAWATNWGLYHMNPGGSPNWGVFNGSANVIDQVGATVVDVWQHVALVRESGVLRLYLGGNLAGSPVADSTNFASTNFRIGAQVPSLGYFHGHMDDVRVTKGVARYTANFTPPSAPHPDF